MGSFDFVLLSPLRPSGRTRSRQKTIGDSVEKERERERRARPISFFSLLVYNNLLLLLQCLSFSLLTDEFLFLPYSLNASQTPREAGVSRLVMMWYDPFLFVPSFVCFHPSLLLCTYAFCDVLLLVFLFLLQVEVPLPTTGGALMEEVTAASFAFFQLWKRSPLVVV